MLSDLQAPFARLPDNLLRLVLSAFDEDDAYSFAMRMAKSGDLSILRWMHAKKFPLGTLDIGSFGWLFLCEVAWTLNVEILEWLYQVAKRPFFETMSIHTVPNPRAGRVFDTRRVYKTVATSLAERAMVSGALPVLKWMRAKHIDFVCSGDIRSFEMFRWLDYEGLLSEGTSRLMAEGCQK